MGGEQTVAVDVADGPRPVRGRPRHRLEFWRSPEGQPAWARPTLLLIAVGAAFAYSYGNVGLNLETFYAAATRSMSESWHNFFFAAFDPWATVSVDKLPGAFWIQALSLRIFGFHLWAIALPQAIEGALTVLVLYRLVQRLAGPVGALVAALALAISPVTVLLNRGNISDTLLILLLVLATDATLRAIERDRWQSLLLAGVYVGLAFQAKMLQAWIVLPALYGAYLLAGHAESLYRRLRNIAVSGLAVLLVSLSWMSAISLVPSASRPYVDGSCDNSIFSQVFLYNAADRLSGHDLTQAGCLPVSPPIQALAKHNALLGVGVGVIHNGIDRFLVGGLGRDDAWLFLPAMVAMVALFVWRRRQPRTDPVRAATVLWLVWLFFTWTFFASSKQLNSYYVAALVPPLAALCGMAVGALWQHRDRPRAVTGVVIATLAGTTAYEVSLVPSSAGIRALIVGSTVLVGLAGMAGLGLSLRSPSPEGRDHRWAIILAAAGLLIGPAWASGTAVFENLGPFETPYQPQALTNLLHEDAVRGLADAPALNRYADSLPKNLAVDTIESSSLAAFDTLITGREFLPVGGFTGQVDEPSLPGFISEVTQGHILRVLVGIEPATVNPDLRWVEAHCQKSPLPSATFTQDSVHFQRYDCVPADAHGTRASAPVPVSGPSKLLPPG